ncbi:MAG: hypothetical protein ABI688_00360 [Bacteroidota bacterium]
MGLLIGILLIIGIVSYFIGRAVYKTQVKRGYKNPKAAGVLVAILTFAIITIAVFLLIISNIRMTR